MTNVPIPARSASDCVPLPRLECMHSLALRAGIKNREVASRLSHTETMWDLFELPENSRLSPCRRVMVH
jgi:hypothetical protein